MKDISNSVVLPEDTYRELSETAWGQSATFGERMAGAAQGTLLFAGLAVAGSGAFWACTKAVDWLEERRLSRERRHRDLHNEPPNK